MTDEQPTLRDQFDRLVAENDVMLFMKGTPDAPRCGFSQRTVQALESLGVEYGAVDVLPVLDPLREITVEVADWRTFPQLYVRGELVGGCDIVEELTASGELAEMLGVEAAAVPAEQPAAPEPAPIQIENA